MAIMPVRFYDAPDPADACMHRLTNAHSTSHEHGLGEKAQQTGAHASEADDQEDQTL